MRTLLLCIGIFLARLLDVSIGSVRTILLVKQKNLYASILAFIEIIIWLFIMKQTLVSSDSNIWLILSYAGGYTAGTYIGGLINKYLVDMKLSVMIITSENNIHMVNTLKQENFGISIIKLEEGKMLLLVEVCKKNLNKLKTLVYEIDTNAFMIINESFKVINGYVK